MSSMTSSWIFLSGLGATHIFSCHCSLNYGDIEVGILVYTVLGENLTFSSLNVMLLMDFSYISLFMLTKFSSNPSLL